MPRLLLIRHAEPAAGWGADGADPGLSGRGRAQAEAAARALVEMGGLRAISSPMLRCRETAASFTTITGVAPRLEPRVSEVAAPEGVADRPAWLHTNFPWQEGAARRTWADVAPALRDWRQGAIAAVREIKHDCVVFTHFIAINAIVTAALRSEETIAFRPGHASITELDSTAVGLRVVRLGSEMAVDDVR